MTASVSDLALASEVALRSCASDAGFGIAGAAVASLAPAGGSWRTYWMAKTRPPAVTIANRAMTIRLVDMAVMILTPCRIADTPQSYTFLSKEGTGLHSENEAYAKLALLTNPALDPFGKIPELKFCAVKAEKVEQRVAAE
jgi:hypothetical protein